MTNITPIFKKGVRVFKDNYQPVSNFLAIFKNFWNTAKYKINNIYGQPFLKISGLFQKGSWCFGLPSCNVRKMKQQQQRKQQLIMEKSLELSWQISQRLSLITAKLNAYDFSLKLQWQIRVRVKTRVSCLEV